MEVVSKTKAPGVVARLLVLDPTDLIAIMTGVVVARIVVEGVSVVAEEGAVMAVSTEM